MSVLHAWRARGFARHLQVVASHHLSSSPASQVPVADISQWRRDFHGRGNVLQAPLVAGFSVAALALGRADESDDIAYCMRSKTSAKSYKACAKHGGKGGKRISSRGAWQPPVLDENDLSDRAFSLVSVRIYAEDYWSRFRAHRGAKSGPRVGQLNSSAPSTLAAPLVVERGISYWLADLAKEADA